MRNFLGVIFIWVRIYGEIFKSALVYFKSGNTVNTEYLNWIPNPEYVTGANVRFFDKKLRF